MDYQLTYPPQVDVGLLTADQIVTASAAEIAATIGELLDEQRRRALEGGDLDALAEEAFATAGFDKRGQANLPYLRDGLLICPGGKMEKSASSHDCCFVSIDGTWVWDHADVAYDEMRQLPGAKVIRQSVSIIPATEALEFDVVTSTARGGGPCQMKTARTFAIRNGVLVETRTRARAPQNHR